MTSSQKPENDKNMYKDAFERGSFIYDLVSNTPKWCSMTQSETHHCLLIKFKDVVKEGRKVCKNCSNKKKNKFEYMVS